MGSSGAARTDDRVYRRSQRRTAPRYATYLLAVATAVAVGCSGDDRSSSVEGAPADSAAPTLSPSPDTTSGPADGVTAEPVEELVVAVAPVDTWRFEGFRVLSHVPDDPVGIVYLFHGSGGSAEFATRVETVDQLNALVERGYGWVATESTERTGDRRWAVGDPSLVTNPDLARLERLHRRLVADMAAEESTPIFGIGMSNGARMVTLFGQSFADAGYPVAAVAPFMGTAARPVRDAGGLTVPGFWVVAENDGTVPNATVVEDRDRSAALGTRTELRTKLEEPLRPDRFLRIPGVDADEAESIHAALVDSGGWDATGDRVVGLNEARLLVAGAELPPTVSVAPGEVLGQVKAILAEHQFVASFRTELADFFDDHRPT